ncbi:MAG: aldo/keto reductase [Candidatus Thorarchaeota archaeon]|nr:aldo/keto reductase [Candidatus Thorarchaeota archaeon]
MQMGWIIDKEASHSLLDTALEAGLNTIDTADIYSKWGEGSYAGKSEEIIGSWLSDRGVREDVVLATKVKGEMSDRSNDGGLSRRHVMDAIEKSLNRLNTDWVDIYWSHSPDQDTPQEETLRAFTSIIESGAVHYIGASNHTAAEIVEALWVSDVNGLARYEAIQPSYSLARRRDFEKHLQPVIEKYDLGVTSYSPLAGGFLTGKYSKDKLPDSKRAETTKARYFKDRNFKIVDTLEELASTHDASVPQIALSWVLAQEIVTAPIIGANSPQQLEENLGALELKLTPDDISRLNEASDWMKMDELAR